MISSASTIPAQTPATSRISADDAWQMYNDLSIHEIGRLAHDVTLQKHPEPYRTYVVDRNINYSNYCTARCIFCNFKADPPGMDSGRRRAATLRHGSLRSTTTAPTATNTGMPTFTAIGPPDKPTRT